MSRTATLCLMVVLLFVFSLAAGQQQPNPASQAPMEPKSVAEIAKESKAKAARAKKVITDEDLASMHGPLPSLDLTEDDNSDEIVEAIGAYREKHTPEETETVVHKWFDEYDSTLATAIRENKKTQDRRRDTMYNGYWGCQDSPDYQTCVVRHRAETRGLHNDQAAMMSDGFMIGHIQQELAKIRSGLVRYGLHYDWFKVRNANGVGSY